MLFELPLNTITLLLFFFCAYHFFLISIYYRKILVSPCMCVPECLHVLAHSSLLMRLKIDFNSSHTYVGRPRSRHLCASRVYCKIAQIKCNEIKLKISPPDFINLSTTISLSYRVTKKGRHHTSIQHTYNIHPDNWLQHYIRHLSTEEFSIK